MSDITKGILTIAITLATIPLGIVVEAFVLTELWELFVVPTFAAPPLGMAYAAGLALMVGMVTHQDMGLLAKEKKEISELLLHVVGVRVGSPLLGLGVGWVIALFI